MDERILDAVCVLPRIEMLCDYLNKEIISWVSDEIENHDLFTKINFLYDDAVASIKTTLESQIKTEFLFQIIAEKLKVEIDEKGFDSYVSYIISNSNGTLKDADSAYNYFGADNKEYGKKYLETQYLVNLAVKEVGEMAKVTYKAETTDTQSGAQQ